MTSPLSGSGIHDLPFHFQPREEFQADERETTASIESVASPRLTQLTEVEHFEKELEDRNVVLEDHNVVIVNQDESNQAMSATLHERIAEVERLRNTLQARNQQIAEMEQELYTTQRLMQERSLLTQEIAGVRETAPAEPTVQNPDNLSFWEKVRNGFSSVGRFVGRHRLAFEAAAGLTGGVLAFVFPPASIPILLTVGGSIALLRWGISLNEE